MPGLREKIIAVVPPALAERTIHVPEWECDVRVIALDGPRLIEFLDSDSKKRHAALVAVSVFDLDGERVFFGPDIDFLHNRPAGMMRVWNVAHDLNPWLFGDSEKNVVQPGVSPSVSA